MKKLLLVVAMVLLVGCTKTDNDPPKIMYHNGYVYLRLDEVNRVAKQHGLRISITTEEENQKCESLCFSIYADGVRKKGRVETENWERFGDCLSRCSEQPLSDSRVK